MSIQSFEDLIVWKKSILLGKEIYKLTQKLPKEEKFILISQMKRASVSILSNIAEGYGRDYTKEYVKFLKIARGSKDELKSQLIFCHNLNYLTYIDTDIAFSLIDEIGKMLNGLIYKLSNT